MKLKTLLRRKSIDRILSEHTPENAHERLHRNLGVKDLTLMGIAAIIGAGIFGTIGNAAAEGGPAVSLLFVFTSLACLFSALCYAQFASAIPIAGSAYTYAYTSFGELVAWIIGWDLLMEYAIGNVTVAISWSDYFTSFLEKFNLHLPGYLSMDYLSARRSYESYLIAAPAEQARLASGYVAWTTAPLIAGIRLIADLPALAINLVITVLVYIGIRESKKTNNFLVIVKLGIIALVIGAGAFYLNPDNWTPFMPHGLSGVMKGVSAVFFAYIGFDAISTTAEESVNPGKDLPKAMLYSLVTCTIIYVVITLVLTGMENYQNLGVGDPLDYVFKKRSLNFLSAIISGGAIVAMTTVLLVFQIGQPRIWMSMSRDGLLPPAFSRIHPRFKTPAFSTVITGIVVGLPILFFNLQEVTDLTSIGTLFAFVLVCGGVLILKPEEHKGSFNVKYVDARYIAPALFAGIWILLLVLFPEDLRELFTWNDAFHHKIPTLFFIAITSVLTVLAYLKRLSLIPLLGLVTNLYLMSQLGILNWMRFLIWLVVGLTVYFCYGHRKSKLN